MRSGENRAKKRARQNRWVKAQRRRVPLEAALEHRAVEWLEEHDGVWAIKVGLRGWPDRLVLIGHGVHFWLEFKRRKFGHLTPAQKRVLPRLERACEAVIIAKTLEEVMAAFYRASAAAFHRTRRGT